jgi:hypothetical protein
VKPACIPVLFVALLATAPAVQAGEDAPRPRAPKVRDHRTPTVEPQGAPAARAPQVRDHRAPQVRDHRRGRRSRRSRHLLRY